MQDKAGQSHGQGEVNKTNRGFIHKQTALYVNLETLLLNTHNRIHGVRASDNYYANPDHPGHWELWC